VQCNYSESKPSQPPNQTAPSSTAGKIAGRETSRGTLKLMKGITCEFGLINKTEHKKGGKKRKRMENWKIWA
jgi:hypothetical protein